MIRSTSLSAPVFRQRPNRTAGVRASLRLVFVIARKEARDALRNRWFVLYALCFAALSLGLAQLAFGGTGRLGLAGFGRTAASLINLVLLVAPLMALTIGAGALAGERERGTLEALLSQPVSRCEVLAGKYLGAAGALLGALSLGFGSTALVLLWGNSAGSLGRFAVIFALSVALAWAMLSVGFLISALARRTTLALGVAVFVWLGLVFVGDLGLMGGALALKMTTQELLVASLVNPLQVFKMLAVSGIHRSLDLLGPAGLLAANTLGNALPLALGAILAAWTLLPLLAAGVIFARRGVA